MIEILLMALSAGIVLLLGLVHLFYTFASNKFSPREHDLRTYMERVSPVITRETSMWKAWVGFNASHSMAGILFGLIYGYLAFYHSELLFQSAFLLLTGGLMLVGLFILAWRYWFRIPLAGISLSLALYLSSVIMVLMS